MKNYYLLALLTIILVISYKIYKRNLEENTFKLDNKKGCVNFGMIALMYGVISMLSFPFVMFTAEGLKNALVDETYMAEVISVRSYESEDDDGGSTTMYVPTVSFTTNKSQTFVVQELDIASGGEYEIGEAHKISYNEETGHVQSKELSTILLMIAGLIFALIIFSFVLYGALYAFYVDLPFSLMQLLLFNFLGIITPLAIIAMDAGMIYYIYQRLVHGIKTDQPVWALIICMFFATVLTILIVVLIKHLLNGELITKLTKSKD